MQTFPGEKEFRIYNQPTSEQKNFHFSTKDFLIGKWFLISSSFVFRDLYLNSRYTFHF